MGRDKLSLEVGGRTLLRRVVDALAERCDEVILAGTGTEPADGARHVRDRRPGQGPLSGMEAGLAAARLPLAFVAAGDMPFLRPALVGHLLDVLADRGALAAVPEHAGRVHPLCAAYAAEALPHVRAALDEGARAARELLGRLGRVAYVGEDQLRRFGEPEHLLMNVNSPEDLRQARGLIPD